MIAAAAIGTIIQARMGAKRLPNKVLRCIGDRPMLGHVLDRHRRMRHGGKLVVATTESARDDAVQQFCAGEGVDCFRGSEEDVLDRYYRAAVANGFRHVIRGTGDNPFVDPYLGDQLVELYFAERSDYAVSKSEDVDTGLPDGIGLEMLAFGALEAAHQRGRLPRHREHINEYILDNPEEFRISVLRVRTPAGAEKLRFTVDTPADFDLAERVHRHVLGTSEDLSMATLLRIASELGQGEEISPSGVT